MPAVLTSFSHVASAAAITAYANVSLAEQERRARQLHASPADYVLKNPLVAELHEAVLRAAAQPPRVRG